MIIGQDLRAVLNRNLWVTPLLDRKSQIGIASIDVRLGTMFSTPEKRRQTVIDPRSKEFVLQLAYRKVHASWTTPFVLHPGSFALAVTLEYVRLDNTIAVRIEGRSSPGRTGLLAVTAGAIHPGYAGCPTLELVNAGETPIVLHPGDKIAQLIVTRVSRSESQEANENFATSRYQIAIDPEDSRWDQDLARDAFISMVDKMKRAKLDFLGRSDAYES